jgi:integrase
VEFQTDIQSDEHVNIFNLAKNAGTSVDQIERFYGKKRMRDPNVATEVRKLREQ